jgi:hypothetical protein
MTREAIEQKMGELAWEYVETRDPKIIDELYTLRLELEKMKKVEQILDVEAAIAVLEDALNRCQREDMRTPEVLAALDFLEPRVVASGRSNSFGSHYTEIRRKADAERQRVVERGQAGCPVEDLIRAPARLLFTTRPTPSSFRFGFSIYPSIVTFLTN